MSIQVRVPDLGDGIESGDVLEILVREGDQIKKDQGIVELETDKATVEVPSSHAGQVSKVLRPGRAKRVAVGRRADHARGPQPAPSRRLRRPSRRRRQPSRRRRPRRQLRPPSRARRPSAAAKPAAGRSGAAGLAAARASAPRPPTRRCSSPRNRPPAPPRRPPAVRRPERASPAGPAVRRFAREVGVDLRMVHGTGPGGTHHPRRRAGSGAPSQPDGRRRGRRCGPRPVPANAIDRQSGARSASRRCPRFASTIAVQMHKSWESVPARHEFRRRRRHGIGTDSRSPAKTITQPAASS